MSELLKRGMPALLIAAALGIALHYTYFVFPVAQAEGNVTVTIAPGASVSRIAGDLTAARVIDNPMLFRLLVKARGVERELKAGRYRFAENQPETETVSMLVKGGITGERVTIAEGLTLSQIASVFWEKVSLDTSRFLELAHDKAFIESLGVKSSSLEGYLFPDTYDVPWGADPSQIIRMMVGRLFEVLGEDHMDQLARSKYTLHEILTMASMVEREAKVPEERPLIAGVLYNRLEMGMPLQCDATVQYALPKYKDVLLYDDLDVDSPYNTYIYYGLPPGPIGSPGRDAILAALYPEETPNLYYVARGDGTHIFSRTQQGHAKAKLEARLSREIKRRK
jgi:UPF0755 protein